MSVVLAGIIGAALGGLIATVMFAGPSPDHVTRREHRAKIREANRRKRDERRRADNKEAEIRRLKKDVRRHGVKRTKSSPTKSGWTCNECGETHNHPKGNHTLRSLGVTSADLQSFDYYQKCHCGFWEAVFKHRSSTDPFHLHGARLHTNHHLQDALKGSLSLSTIRKVSVNEQVIRNLTDKYPDAFPRMDLHELIKQNEQTEFEREKRKRITMYKPLSKFDPEDAPWEAHD